MCRGPKCHSTWRHIFAAKGASSPLALIRWWVDRQSHRSSIGVVVLGALGGQGLLVFVSPLLTRLYSPSDFGLFTVLSALSAVLGVAIIGRMDAAITLPRSGRVAAAVVWLSILLATVGSSVIAIVGAFWGYPLMRRLGTPELSKYWMLIALTSFAVALDQIFIMWMVRTRRFKAIGARNFYQGSGQACVQVTTGYLGLRPSGLLWGLLAGRITALGGIFSSSGLLHQGRPRWRLMRGALSSYRRFAYFGALSAIINVIGQQAPILVIGAEYGQDVVGWLGITVRVLAAPMALIGVAVGRVFQGDVSALLRSRQANLRALVTRNLRTLLLIASPITILALTVAPFVFPFIFGHAWAQAGVFASGLAIGYFAQLVVSPVSQLLVLLDHQALFLSLDVLRLLLTVGVPLTAAQLGASAQVSVVLVGLMMAVAYSAYLLACIWAARRHDASPLVGNRHSERQVGR